MRVSTFQIHTQAAQQLQALGAQTAKTQQQIGLGKKLITPGDDPVGAARVVDINRELAARTQYTENIHSAEAQLALEDAVLDQVIEVIQRVSELTLQAGSGVQTAQDREFIAAEIERRFEELIALGNTKNANGQFLFSGYTGEVEPFVVSGDTVVYRGDAGQRTTAIDRGQLIDISDSGRAVFIDVPAEQVQAEVWHSSSADANVSQVRVDDPELATAFYPDRLIVEFRPLSEAGGVTNYTVRRQSDQRPVDGLVNVPYSPGEDIVAAGIRFKVQGSPLPGETVTLATTLRKSLFNTVRDVANGLVNTDAVAEPDAFRQLIDSTIAGLNNATDVVLQTRADIGARFNTMAATKDLHEELAVQLQATRSDLEDLDFTEAISDLAYQSFVLEAAQQSFVRINALSLFNRL